MNWNSRAEGLKSRVITRLKAKLPPDLYYHSPEHTLDVMQASEMIAKQEGCTEEEILLVKTAAVFHDTGYIIDMREHEHNSCNIASEMLAGEGFSAPDIEKICEIIMATRIPQSPKDKLGEILCDADLDYLGRDDYFTKAGMLFREFVSHGKIKNEDEWKLVQIHFLQAHRYFTKTSVALRQAKKEENLLRIKSGLISA